MDFVLLGHDLGHAWVFGLRWAIRSQLLWAKNMFKLRVRPIEGIGPNVVNWAINEPLVGMRAYLVLGLS